MLTICRKHAINDNYTMCFIVVSIVLKQLSSLPFLFQAKELLTVGSVVEDGSLTGIGWKVFSQNCTINVINAISFCIKEIKA